MKQAVTIARKLTDATLMQISDPAGNSVAGWKHAVLHFLRVHMDATLSEVLDWTEEMERVRAALALRRGEFIVLVGPSGCGKSTTHRMIADSVESVAGVMRIDRLLDRKLGELPGGQQQHVALGRERTSSR